MYFYLFLTTDSQNLSLKDFFNIKPFITYIPYQKSQQHFNPDSVNY